jgi:hypothetical protein
VAAAVRRGPTPDPVGFAGREATVKVCGVTVVILGFRVSQGCDLRRPVVDSVADGTLAA